MIAETMFWNELFVFLKCFATNAHRVSHTHTDACAHAHSAATSYCSLRPVDTNDQRDDECCCHFSTVLHFWQDGKSM